MRILQITPEAPSLKSGGGIGIRQTILSLSKNGYDVDYIGPEIEDETCAVLYRNTFYLEPGHNVLLRAIDSMFMNTNARYRSWKKLKIDFKSYDAILLEFTKLHYVIKRIGDMPLIVRVHNVEQDYSKNNFRHNRSFLNLAEAVFAAPRERILVKRADRLAVLTEEDAKRLTSLYGISESKITRIPVCVPEVKKDPRMETMADCQGEIRMLITGSLWYGSNYEGILWFIKNVFLRLDMPKRLCIAGARPNPGLIELVGELTEAEIIDTPEDMAPYFNRSELFIAPIFDGAGMKVKVAEALAYGLPVVGTSHAFIGYAIRHGENSYIADTADEFIRSIKAYYGLDLEEKENMSARARELYRENYSIDKSAELFGNVVSAQK